MLQADSFNIIFPIVVVVAVALVSIMTIFHASRQIQRLMTGRDAGECNRKLHKLIMARDGINRIDYYVYNANDYDAADSIQIIMIKLLKDIINLLLSL